MADDQAVLLTDLDAVAELEDDWRALAVARGNPHVTPEFFRSWLESFGEHARPFAPALLDGDGRLRGLLPLVVTTDQLRQVQVAGGDFWMPLDIVAADDAEIDVAEAAGRLLARHRRAWRMTMLENVPADAPWLERFVASLSHAYRGGLSRRQETHPWLLVDLSQGWEAYLAGKRSKVRHEMRRCERRLHEAYDVRVRRSASATELTTDLATTFRLHALRRAGLGSTFDAPAMRETLERFALRAFERGWLGLRVMTIDGAEAAAVLDVCLGDRAAGYLIAWDPRWATQSVGRVVLIECLRSAAQDGVREFDLSVGTSDVKARHATAERTVTTVWLYPRRARVLLGVRRAARRVLPDGVRKALGGRLRAEGTRSELPG